MDNAMKSTKRSRVSGQETAHRFMKEEQEQEDDNNSHSSGDTSNPRTSFDGDMLSDMEEMNKFKNDTPKTFEKFTNDIPKTFEEIIANAKSIINGKKKMKQGDFLPYALHELLEPFFHNPNTTTMSTEVSTIEDMNLENRSELETSITVPSGNMTTYDQISSAIDQKRKLLADARGKENFQLFATYAKELMELERKLERERMELEWKLERERMELERKLERERMELERKLEQKLVASCDAIQKSHTRVTKALMQLASLGQESSQAISILDSDIAKKKKYYLENIITDTDPNKQRAPSIDQYYSWVLDTKTNFPEGHQFHIDKLCQHGTKRILSHLSEQYATYLTSTTKLSRPKTKLDKENYEQRIKEGLDHFFSNEEGTMVQDSGCFGRTKRSRTNYFSPGLCGQEVSGVEPVMIRVIREMLTQIITHRGDPPSSSDHSSSPPKSPKSMICSQRPLVNVTHVHEKDVLNERVPDLTIMKLGSFMYVIWPDTLQLCFEIKPTSRKSSTPETLWNEAFIQVLSHLSKYCLEGWIMLTAGVNIHATGVVATMYGVEIVMMRAINPCSENATIELLSTHQLPLMSQNTFTEWVNGNGLDDAAITNIHETFYSKHFYNDKVPPPGWMALWQLFHTRSSELFGISDLIEDRELLGYGTFGYVLKKDDDMVMKVSRFCRTQFLDKEKEAYEKIGSNEYLLKLESQSEDFVLQLGKVSVKVPSLTLSPLCQKLVPTLVSCGKDLHKLNSFLIKIIGECKLALDHIHSKDYTVNDISYENIMIYEGCAKLIDLSNAEKLGISMKRFSGTPPFVHRKVHRKPSGWTTSEDVDHVSLSFVIAALYQSLVKDNKTSCVIPWDEKFLSGRVTDITILDDRNAKAQNIIRDALSSSSRLGLSANNYNWMMQCLSAECH